MHHFKPVLSTFLFAIQWLGFCGCFTGLLSPMLPAMTLVLTTAKQPGPPFGGAKFFSLPLFKWLADITYDIYLIHPLVRR
jgi:peptidoglycan/LPS O-acetylase OafA/YrhL